MGSWRDVAAGLVGDQAQPSSKLAAGTGAYGLDSAIEAGLARLSDQPPPKFVGDPAAWRTAVADARMIARDGWAARAVSLGWSAHDLFGVGPEDDLDFAGPAVWLSGRSLTMLDERRAMARFEGGRAYFERGGSGHGRGQTDMPVLLWQFGRT